jgi:hypothetical protein
MARLKRAVEQNEHRLQAEQRANNETAAGKPVPTRNHVKVTGKSYKRDVSSAFWSAGHAAWGTRAWGVDHSLRREVRHQTH